MEAACFAYLMNTQTHWHPNEPSLVLQSHVCISFGMRHTHALAVKGLGWITRWWKMDQRKLDWKCVYVKERVILRLDCVCVCYWGKNGASDSWFDSRASLIAGFLSTSLPKNCDSFSRLTESILLECLPCDTWHDTHTQEGERECHNLVCPLIRFQWNYDRWIWFGGTISWAVASWTLPLHTIVWAISRRPHRACH